MIIRIMVLDPAPRNPQDDIIVYQVPEHSRAHELLVEMVEAQGYDHVLIESSYWRKKKSDAQ